MVGSVSRLQIEALHADKRGLDKVLAQRQGDLDELHGRLKASMVSQQHAKPLAAPTAMQGLQMRVPARAGRVARPPQGVLW